MSAASSFRRTTPDTVYLAATRYKLADYQPVSVPHPRRRTHLAVGSTATFPRDEITRVIRADPAQPGLLFVGTETGVFFSIG